MARTFKPTGTKPAAVSPAAVGKRVQFDLETWQSLDLLARDRMMTFQELADEAFRDVLKKHGRPMGLRDALKRSARQSASNTNEAAPSRSASKTATSKASKRKRPAGSRRARS